MINQILSFQNSANGRRIMYDNVKKLCIFLILFALVMIGQGGWRLHTNLKKHVNVDKPILTGRRNLNKTIFDIKADNGVKKIIYQWVSEDPSVINEENVIEKNGEKETSFEIDNRIGVNELSIKIIDSKGNTITYNEIKIVYDEDVVTEPIEQEDPPAENIDDAIANDKEKPTIDVKAGKAELTITATDKVRIAYVTYKWNDGEEVKVTGLSEDEKTINTTIPAMKGNNTIKITAVDRAGNKEEYENDVHGTDGPKIEVRRDMDTEEIVANITDEYGITKIEYSLNDEVKTIENIEGTSYELRLKMVDGENKLIIHAYEGNVKSEYKGKTTK